ncbi:MAG: sigma-54-dependent transcriptional regulator [Myxococcota bacterium]
MSFKSSLQKRDATVVVVDDDEDVLAAGRMLLRRHFSKVETLTEPDELLKRMPDLDPDAILLDLNFSPGERSGREGLSVLERVLIREPDAVVVLITAHADVATAVDAMKRGATDFVAKPWENQRLLATVNAAVTLRASRREAQVLRRQNDALVEDSAVGTDPLLFRAPSMEHAMSMAERSAPTDANVLILGEPGTGKELVARAIHRHSRRRDQVFVSVDLGAVSESVFESELFGHRKGAFTDAKRDRAGRFQAARGGTIFLDEVGNLPLHLQSKLLTVLEQRRVTPVGSDQPVDVDVRVVAATNRPPHELADPNLFRQDLLFRLNTVEIHLPPLRERPEDIPLLVDHYLALFSRRYGKPEKPVSEATYATLKRYLWPGNVRALRHAAERAVILSTGSTFHEVDFSIPATAQAAAARSQDDGGQPDDLNLERLERSAVTAALRRHNYNISQAAKELGITRAALYRRMEKHGL